MLKAGFLTPTIPHPGMDKREGRPPTHPHTVLQISNQIRKFIYILINGKYEETAEADNGISLHEVVFLFHTPRK